MSLRVDFHLHSYDRVFKGRHANALAIVQAVGNDGPFCIRFIYRNVSEFELVFLVDDINGIVGPQGLARDSNGVGQAFPFDARFYE
jgi:hypothetical protein